MTELRKSQLYDVIALNKEIQKCGINLSAVMDVAVERICDVMGASGAVIELKEHDSLVYRAGSGALKNTVGVKIPFGEGLSSESLMTKSTLQCPNVMLDNRVRLDLCQQLGIKAMMVSPLLHNDKAVGVLKVAWSEPHEFKKTDAKFLDLVCEQIGTSIFLCTKYSNENLIKLATTDFLTELSNRSVFMASLRDSLSLQNNSFVLFVIDMNGLKAINDKYGHKAGDAALVELGKRLRTCTRGADVISRIGGDEFAVLMPRLSSNDAHAFIARIKHALSEQFTYLDLSCQLSASIGFALYPNDGTDPEVLIHVADKRMYENKKESKNGIQDSYSI